MLIKTTNINVEIKNKKILNGTSGVRRSEMNPKIPMTAGMRGVFFN